MKRTHALLCVLALLAGVPMAAGEVSQLWGRDGEKWDPAGRLPDFSFAGYHRGEAPPADRASRGEREEFRCGRRWKDR